eukprot:175173-Pyramimonas_sp.AAC.1
MGPIWHERPKPKAQGGWGIARAALTQLFERDCRNHADMFRTSWEEIQAGLQLSCVPEGIEYARPRLLAKHAIHGALTDVEFTGARYAGAFWCGPVSGETIAFKLDQVVQGAGYFFAPLELGPKALESYKSTGEMVAITIGDSISHGNVVD